ncbi:serine--tRNA ligase [Novosphingobium jiangmenense]|uniref:Serine--tRNA ligase n=1 Tax=Novosphingobium jiangmenense TaxID=2791981 RepID=A0ABS0HK66_9SPHN|nr:serine--tRNA ligase [Novosphingobium jiangmenense]MBF9152647.1 serine--tRNA ligase [Novosphingobium jiangmenense]
MHDIRLIRENPAAFDAALARRGVEPISHLIVEHDRVRRELQTKADVLRAERKRLSGIYGQLAARGEGNTPDALEFKDQSIKIAQSLSQIEKLQAESADVSTLLEGVPNTPAPEVPDGMDESQNVELLRWGTPRSYEFTPAEHADLGPALGLDFETGALISGSRFTFLKGGMARLHRALAQFMLDRQTEKNGYVECIPPLLVKDEAVYGTGQLPKFSEDLFQTYISFNEFFKDVLKELGEDAVIVETATQKQISTVKQLIDRLKARQAKSPEARRWLIPTAEVSLTNAVQGQILGEAQLPLRMTALTPCFRSEAGAAGRDTRGFIRQHQFEKVELVSITKPEDSEAEHERMTACAEGVLQALGLPYRKVLLCTGDMGFTARKTYDLEVWLPGQGAYREISSCSNCGDFQARRMNARYRPEGAKGTEFVHTLNGSGLAVGRTLVAVLENYQREDGSVDVPEVLRPYMGGLTRLVPLA